MDRDIVIDLFFKNKYKIIQKRVNGAILYKIYKREKVFLMRYDTNNHKIIKFIAFDENDCPYFIENMAMLYGAI